MSTTIVEGFSVSHAAILDGTTGAEASVIYGVRDGSITLNTGVFDNTGDDTILSSWFWFNYAELKITSGFITFATVSYLSGDAVTSSGTSPNDYYSLPLWTDSTLNQPRKPALIRVPSKDSAGDPRHLDIILYNVQFSMINFTGPNYKTGLTVDYMGRALRSTHDETGATLTEPAVGRLLSKP